MAFNPQPKKGLPDKKLRKPLKRTQIKRFKPKRVSSVVKKGHRPALIGILDSVFSKYIRNKYADERGFVKCFTCSDSRPVSQMQNGHFISRRHMNTRYEEKNCRPQCKECNLGKRGNLKVYAANLGDQAAEEITNLSHQIKRWTPDELQEAINHYRHANTPRE